MKVIEFAVANEMVESIQILTWLISFISMFDCYSGSGLISAGRLSGYLFP